MKNEKLMVNQFFWQRITRLLEHISSKVWENCRGLESGPERRGIGSVIELATAKQVYKFTEKLIILRRLVVILQLSCRSFDSFNLKASL